MDHSTQKFWSQQAGTHGIYASAVCPGNQQIREFQNGLFRLFSLFYLYFLTTVVTLTCFTSSCYPGLSREPFWLILTPNPHLDYPVPILVFIGSRIRIVEGGSFPPQFPPLSFQSVTVATSDNLLCFSLKVSSQTVQKSCISVWSVKGNSRLSHSHPAYSSFSQKFPGFCLLASEGRSFI